MHPEDLGPGLFEDLPLLLDGGGIDPVLGVEESPFTFILCLQDPLNALEAWSRAACLGKRSPSKVSDPSPK